MLHSQGFDVRSIKPDIHSVSVVACAVVQVSLLIGTNSGSYNAVFLQSGGGVLELAPHASEFYLFPRLPDTVAEAGSRVNSWQIGFERLGVHQLVYACTDLFAAYKCDSSPNADMAEPCNQFARNPELRPIVVSPKSILRLLGELQLAIQDSRETSAEIMTMGSIMPVGSTIVRNCFPWEIQNITGP
jgi:hypothetical protein